MNDLFTAAKEAVDCMKNRYWECCVIGGLAVQRWGEPRTTLGADIVLLADWGRETAYITAILDRFESRIAGALEFAVANRVLLIQASNGASVDVSLGVLPFEVRMVGRAVAMEFAPGLVLPCCSADDLIVMKAFAGRPRNWIDAEGVVARHPKLDVQYILSALADLGELKGDQTIVARAAQLLQGHLQ